MTGRLASDLYNALFAAQPALAQSSTITYVGPGTYDLSTAVYAGAAESFDVSSEEVFPTAIVFNDDGSKMFVLGTDSDTIHEYALGTAYDVSTATYSGAGEAFATAGQDLSSNALTFSADGAKMFVLGNTNNTVYEYSLGTAFDVSTASYGGTSLAVGAQDSSGAPTGLAFNTDGTRMYMAAGNNWIVEYTLSTGFDLSTAVFPDNQYRYLLGNSSNVGNVRNIVFSEDGSELFAVLSRAGATDVVARYTLAQAFDASTATFTEEFVVGTEEDLAFALAFGNAGAKMFVGGNTNATLYEYQLTSGNYLEAVVNDGSIDGDPVLVMQLDNDTFQDGNGDNLLDVGSEVTINNVPAGLTPVMTLSDGDATVTLTFAGNATSHADSDDVAALTFVFDNTAFTGGDASVVANSGSGGAHSPGVGIDFNANLRCLIYTVPDTYDVSTAVYSGLSLTVSTEDALAGGLVFNPDGTKLLMLGQAGGEIFEYGLTTAFDISTATYSGNSFAVSSQDAQATGLFVSASGTQMFIAGNTSDSIYAYDLTTAFDITTANYSGTAFSVVGETDTPFGLAFNPTGSKMFVLNGTDDRIIEYALSTPFDISTASSAGVAEEFWAGGQEDSITGFAFNEDGSRMYVVGLNDDAFVFEYYLGTAFDVSTAMHASSSEAFPVFAEDTFPFSLGFGNSGTKMYIGGAATGAIYQYDLDPAAYTESVANDGSITSPTSVVIALTDDTFQDLDGDDLLDVGSEVIIGNIPAGLTPVMTLSAGDTIVTFTFVGNAFYHQNSDDVADLTFSFDDTAFTSGDAATVKKSGSSTPYSSWANIDFEDGLVDTDLDGEDDSTDLDDDNDGILDTVERANAQNGGDTDGDSFPDIRDLDSDNDGIPDNVEAQPTIGYIAPNGDAGVANGGLDTAYPGGLTPVNTDSPDALPDYLDDDSEQDGIPDIQENGMTNTPSTADTDSDGLLDDFEGADNNDGFDPNDEIDNPSASILPDSDGDVATGVPGINDLDYRDAVTPLAKSTLGDWVWYDVDGDGTKDGTEPGINGVIVNLYLDNNSGGTLGVLDPSDTFITTTTTVNDGTVVNGNTIDSDDALAGEPGAYDFQIDQNETYLVQIDPANFDPGNVLASYTMTSTNAGSTNVLTHAFTASEDYNDADFGFTLPAGTPAVALMKTLNGDNPFRVGDVVSFTINITNTGTVTITSLPLEDIYNTFFLTFDAGNPGNLPAPTVLPSGVLSWTNLAPANGLAPLGTVRVDVYFTVNADTTALVATPPCTANEQAPNLAQIENAIADPDGAGLQPSVPVPTEQSCAGVQVLTSTAVNLASSSVKQTTAGVTVQWTTITEQNVAGFRIYRINGLESTEVTEMMTQSAMANPSERGLIPAKKSGQSSGASYSMTNVGTVIFPNDIYVLETVQTDGSNVRNVLETVNVFSIYLPMTTR